MMYDGDCVHSDATLMMIMMTMMLVMRAMIRVMISGSSIPECWGSKGYGVLVGFRSLDSRILDPWMLRVNRLRYTGWILDPQHLDPPFHVLLVWLVAERSRASARARTTSARTRRGMQVNAQPQQTYGYSAAYRSTYSRECLHLMLVRGARSRVAEADRRPRMPLRLKVRHPVALLIYPTHTTLSAGGTRER